jgi:eukaryotic-like serine/threonine-protein kinase
LADQTLTKAYALRDRGSELEKLSITAYYQAIVLQDSNKAMEAYEFLRRTYPRDYPACLLLGLVYANLGRFEDALVEHQESVRLRPSSALSREAVSADYIQLDRLEEAKTVLDKAIAEKIQYPAMHRHLYDIAFMRGDSHGMQQEVDWAKANPASAGAILASRVQAEIFSGKIREAKKLASEAPQQTDFSDRWTPLSPRERALLGVPQIPESRPANLMATALAGNPAQVTILIDEKQKASPQNTLLNFVEIPVARAAMAIRSGNGAKAVEFLNTAKPYEGASGDVTYTRGLAYLQMKSPREAAAEFQKMIGNRGAAGLSVLYPLSHLGLARANALAGDLPKARKSYQEFLALWKDADADIPILIQAKEEYAKLN